MNIKKKILDHPFLRNMSDEHLNLVAQNAKEVQLQAGQVLFREGEPANRFFLIISGKVALEAATDHGEIDIQTVGSGEVLGWSWLFPPFSWHLTARVIEPTNAIVLDGAHLLVTAEEDHDFGYDLMRRISQVVINRLMASRSKLEQLTCA